MQAYNAAHPQARLDPQAVLAVASQEGLGGGIGDNGTSFGPFQLHQGGAYPSSAPQDAAAAQAWATSPEGIDYALGRIGTVAGGLHGGQAVQNIVSRFERPANIPREVAGALRAYGLPVPAGGTSGSALARAASGAATASSPAPPAPPPVDYQPQLAQLFAGARHTGDFGQFYGTLAKALRARQPT